MFVNTQSTQPTGTATPLEPRGTQEQYIKTERNENSKNESDGGIFNLPCAPVFYPTEEEFSDPWKYLSSIREKVVETGICVIQPPEGSWDFSVFHSSISPKSFQFETKAQNVHQMQNRTGPTVQFLLRLNK